MFISFYTEYKIIYLGCSELGGREGCRKTRFGLAETAEPASADRQLCCREESAVEGDGPSAVEAVAEAESCLGPEK
jgi:hypothetical protein